MELGRLDPRAGLAQWSALFARKPASSRMTISTSWGWLAWEAVDSEAAHLARLAASTPAPVLVEIAVGDHDSQEVRSAPTPGRPRRDRRLECADRLAPRWSRRRLTRVNVHVWLHQSDVAEDNDAPGGIPVGQPPEFCEAAYQLRRTLWALATDRADDPRAALAGMSHYASSVLELIEARERVRRADAVLVAPPAPPLIV